MAGRSAGEAKQNYVYPLSFMCVCVCVCVYVCVCAFPCGKRGKSYSRRPPLPQRSHNINRKLSEQTQNWMLSYVMSADCGSSATDTPL